MAEILILDESVCLCVQSFIPCMLMKLPEVGEMAEQPFSSVCLERWECRTNRLCGMCERPSGVGT